MVEGLPITVMVAQALSRCAIVNGNLGLWESLLLSAVARYQANVVLERDVVGLGAGLVARQLDSFQRSLSRSASLRSTLKHWARLSTEGRIFVEMRLRSQVPPIQGFDELDLQNRSDLMALRDAVKAARHWLSDKPGKEHGAPVRMLVRDVARVYHQATRKRPGLSSSEAVAGSSYKTPFEELLVAVLSEAGTPLSLEAARSLFRSELRNKPKQ